MWQHDQGNNAPDSGETISPPSSPPQPPKNSRRSWIIGCSIAAGIVIVLCAVLGVMVFRSLIDPRARETYAKATIQDFCLDLQIQEYALAYDHLSTAAKGRMGTVDQFMNDVATLDRSAGIITSCGIDLDTLRRAAVHSAGERMDVYVRVYRGTSTSNDPNPGDKVKIRLVFENDAWKVDDASPAHILF